MCVVGVVNSRSLIVHLHIPHRSIHPMICFDLFCCHNAIQVTFPFNRVDQQCKCVECWSHSNGEKSSCIAICSGLVVLSFLKWTRCAKFLKLPHSFSFYRNTVTSPEALWTFFQLRKTKIYQLKICEGLLNLHEVIRYIGFNWDDRWCRHIFSLQNCFLTLAFTK